MLGVENLTVHLRAEDVKLVEEVAAFAKAPEGVRFFLPPSSSLSSLSSNIGN